MSYAGNNATLQMKHCVQQYNQNFLPKRVPATTNMTTSFRP